MDKKYDYSLLKGKMAEKGYNIKTLAESIGISRSALSLRLNQRTRSGFSQREMVQIANVLEINLDIISHYFFNFDVQKREL
mgnify:CR=1 FL=1